VKITKVPAIQDLAWCLGSDGCYYICLCAIAEEITGKEIDLIKTAKRMIDNKIIDYDWRRPKAYKNMFYITDADKLLKALGCKEHIEKVDELPKGYKGKYIVRYTLDGNTHFVLPNYNSITYSNCVANGRISKYYLVTQ
jgi:hypothetical protein